MLVTLASVNASFNAALPFSLSGSPSNPLQNKAWKPQAFSLCFYFFCFLFFALLEISHRAFTYAPNGVTPKTRAKTNLKGVHIMCIETRSQTIAEAIDKLYALKTADLVYHADSWGLTEAQKTELNEYLNWIDYTRDDASEDRKLALENCYVNLTDDHIYVLEMADCCDDVNAEYYFVELVPLTEIYKDANGNLWNWCDYDKDEKLHEMTVVECDDGHYTDTCITWFFTQAELNAMTKISINA
jgi:hypothetical protein